jgi:hypothetical protein
LKAFGKMAFGKIAFGRKAVATALAGGTSSSQTFGALLCSVLPQALLPEQ